MLCFCNSNTNNLHFFVHLKLKIITYKNIHKIKMLVLVPWCSCPVLFLNFSFLSCSCSKEKVRTKNKRIVTKLDSAPYVDVSESLQNVLELFFYQPFLSFVIFIFQLLLRYTDNKQWLLWLHPVSVLSFFHNYRVYTVTITSKLIKTKIFRSCQSGFILPQ